MEGGPRPEGKQDEKQSERRRRGGGGGGGGRCQMIMRFFFFVTHLFFLLPIATPYGPLSSALTLLANARKPAGFIIPAASCPRMAASFADLVCDPVAFDVLLTLIHAMEMFLSPQSRKTLEFLVSIGTGQPTLSLAFLPPVWLACCGIEYLACLCPNFNLKSQC